MNIIQLGKKKIKVAILNGARVFRLYDSDNIYRVSVDLIVYEKKLTYKDMQALENHINDFFLNRLDVKK